MSKINTRLLVSGADYFDDGFAINAYMDEQIPVDVARAIAEHKQIQEAFKQAGIEVTKVDPPEGCQDGVYTANWALVRDKKAVMANLPNKRKQEEQYARGQLEKLGFEIEQLPQEFRFSGQGDALACGKYLFVGTGYRTSPEVHPLLAQELGYEVIGVKTIPERDTSGNPIINPVTGWEDSFFYDLDLALAIIKPPSDKPCPHGNHTSDDSADEQAVRCNCRGLIAWCPEAFEPASQERIRAITDLEKIEVSLEEAMQASACNLVSTGETVIMGAAAPRLRKALEEKGLKVLPQDVSELMKGGGFIRCCSLTII